MLVYIQQRQFVSLHQKFLQLQDFWFVFRHFKIKGRCQCVFFLFNPVTFAVGHL